MVLVVFNTEVVCYENGHFGTTDTYRYMYVLQVSNIFYIASLFLEKKCKQNHNPNQPFYYGQPSIATAVHENSTNCCI